MIRLENIYKYFYQNGKKLTALNGVSLQVPQGKIFGVIGASGAGKSTLIRCVNLLEQPSSGDVFIGDVNVTKLNHKDLVKLRRSIGMIFQHFNLLSNKNVYDNIALALKLSGGSKTEIRKRVDELLDLVNLSDKKSVYPANLSGGQKQRVAIARALAAKPDILLCDEATSALDPATTKSILTLLREINQKLGITILLITHEMEVVKNICDGVAVIDKGQLVEQGSVSDIFSNPKTALVKEFIASSFHVNLPQEYMDSLSAENDGLKLPVIRFDFTGQSVDAPIISMASKKYDINFSILSSQIDYAGGVKFGFVIAEVEGSIEAIERAKNYLIEHRVKVEVLGYV